MFVYFVSFLYVLIFCELVFYIFNYFVFILIKKINGLGGMTFSGFVRY